MVEWRRQLGGESQMLVGVCYLWGKESVAERKACEEELVVEEGE